MILVVSALPLSAPVSAGERTGEAESPVSLEFVERTEKGTYEIATGLIMVTAEPVVVFDEIPTDVTGQTRKKHVTVSGHVIDPVADITDGPAGNVQRITVNGSPVPFTVERSALPATEERPHPKKFSFTTTVPLDAFRTVISVEATNAIGKRGHGSVRIMSSGGHVREHCPPTVPRWPVYFVEVVDPTETESTVTVPVRGDAGIEFNLLLTRREGDTFRGGPVLMTPRVKGVPLPDGVPVILTLWGEEDSPTPESRLALWHLALVGVGAGILVVVGAWYIRRRLKG